jgi:hypothetical protein
VDGRGVEIVEALSDTWGAQALPGGKVVWADLDVPDPPDLADRPD